MKTFFYYYKAPSIQALLTILGGCIFMLEGAFYWFYGVTNLPIGGEMISPSFMTVIP